MGAFEELCPLAEALDAAMLADRKPSARWQEASTTGVEALTAATEELMVGGGADELGAEGAFEDDGLATEGIGAKEKHAYHISSAACSTTI